MVHSTFLPECMYCGLQRGMPTDGLTTYHKGGTCQSELIFPISQSVITANNGALCKIQHIHIDPVKATSTPLWSNFTVWSKSCMVLVFYNKKTTHVFNKFQSYDNIVEKGCAGGLKISCWLMSLTLQSLCAAMLDCECDEMRWNWQASLVPHLILADQWWRNLCWIPLKSSRVQFYTWIGIGITEIGMIHVIGGWMASDANYSWSQAWTHCQCSATLS